MTDELSETLTGAKMLARPTDRVDRIKEAVADQMRKVDGRIQIDFTSYFNHSYIPDMVMRWPSTGTERYLFVRGDADPRWLREDLEVVGEKGPLLFTMEGMPQEERGLEWAQAVKAKAADSGTWIVDAGGVSALQGGVQGSTPVRLLAQGLAEGGRGLTSEDDIEQLAALTGRGFDAARELDGDDTALAVSALESNLDEERSGRFTRLLRAVWEGSGGGISYFPSTSSLGALTDDDFLYLLENLENVSPAFWRGVGAGIRVERLARLQRASATRNFSSLVEAVLDRLYAKAARVHATEGEFFGEAYPRWSVDHGCLTFVDTDYSMWFAARRLEELPSRSEQKLPVFADASRKVTPALSISSVELLTAEDRTVEYSSNIREDVLRDKQLNALAKSAPTRVSRMTAVIAQQNATLDFAKASVSTPTNGALPLVGLMRASAMAHAPANSGWGASVDSYIAARLRAIRDVEEESNPGLFPLDDAIDSGAGEPL